MNEEITSQEQKEIDKQLLLEDVVHLSQRYKLIFSDSQVALLDRALLYSIRMHLSQKRKSGEPYITHPVAVANLLLDIGLDCATVAAALMHDCVEDTSATGADIKRLFGDEIEELVLGVTKLDKIVFKSKEEEQAENFRRMFFAMAKDIRVILIKLADRLHNMRTIEFLSQERQIAMAKETLDIYAPLASRLGISFYKCELDDLCLKVLHPEAYEELVQQISLKRAERQELVTEINRRLSETLKEHGIKGEVSGRPKHFYSIYKKMVNQHKTFDQIYDLTAMRVIVPTIKDCYEVLGTIHTIWKPIPGRFKDYIAVPKPNNYQSLHTTVLTERGMPFEIQIRTFEMHKIAEYGIAAHWKYKENRTATSDLDNKLEWLRTVMSEQATDSSPQEFYESLKLDLYSGEVFIFTPRGDVMVLPEGSTPVDFAYSVHSEVGNKCVGAKVNNKIVPLETKLHTGDYVEIITNPNSKGPSHDWLRFVMTAGAKSKIRSFFKKELKEDNIRLGREMLEREAKNKGYVPSELLQPKWLDLIVERYSFSSIDDLCASIGYGGFTYNQVIAKLIDYYKIEHPISPKITEKTSGKRSYEGKGVIVKGHADLMVRLAKCCSPVPGDDIVGYISHGRGVTVHRRNCPNLNGIEDYRLIEAHWSDSQSRSFLVTLSIECKDTGGVLAKITAAISEMKLNIVSMTARVIDKNQRAIITLTIPVNSVEDADAVIARLSRLRNVDKVYRATT